MPDVDVSTETIAPRALSGPPYVYVADLGGTASHPTLVEQPSIQVVTYARGTVEEVGQIADEITAILLDAWASGSRTDYGYLSRFSVQSLPYAQAISGIPAGVSRFFAQYALSIRPVE